MIACIIRSTLPVADFLLKDIQVLFKVVNDRSRVIVVEERLSMSAGCLAQLIRYDKCAFEKLLQRGVEGGKRFRHHSVQSLRSDTASDVRVL